MTPRARITGLEIVEQDGGLLIRDLATRTEHVLHPLTAFVWTHADGLTDVDGLAARATGALNTPITTDQVWAAIDVLTGARLLEDRIAPPAGVQRFARRDLLRSVAVGSAAAAAIGVATMPASAQTNKVSQESASKVAQEASQKKAQEEKDKALDLKARQEDQKKAQESAEKQQHQQQENSNKQQEQAQKSSHEEDGKSAQEQKSKNQNPFTDVILEADWANFGEGWAPLSFERRGAHVHLIGLIQFTGEPEFLPEEGEIQVTAIADVDPPDPDNDEFEIETMLIGRLPEGARPAGHLAFTVTSDTLIGASEVQITADGEILLVLDDEGDDQLDDVSEARPQSPKDKAATAKCQRRKLLRLRRKHARLQRLKRKLLRKRARLARKRCSDGKEVFLTGPSEISLTGISFRVK